MAGKVVVDEEDKIIEFLTLILFHFLRFGDVKIPIERKNQYIVLILDETFRGVMIFKDSFQSSSMNVEQSYLPFTVSRASAQKCYGVSTQ